MNIQGHFRGNGPCVACEQEVYIPIRLFCCIQTKQRSEGYDTSLKGATYQDVIHQQILRDKEGFANNRAAETEKGISDKRNAKCKGSEAPESFHLGYLIWSPRYL